MWDKLMTLALRILVSILFRWLGKLGKWLLLIIYKWLKSVLRVVRFLIK